MNPFEMVAVIVVAVMVASVLRARYGYRRRRGQDGGEVAPAERAETLRLKEEVKQLKERLHVLERIAVDKENSVARQIEELRDR
ncbi:MAG: hypothetical protein H0W65_00355 [Sphingomonas sp.]|uniref:hypothetical protein n=1 Tax=Sphingomonas sp. TaxID=28214 RepID=UPI0017FF8729|nr:hypothetical protein [Sphingomonas sp.]MBA3666161.1 hypothetical protein [Sphingomonas sp.]